MLRPGTSRLLLATFPHVHVRFLSTTSPTKLDPDSRPTRPNDSSKESTLNSPSEHSTSTSSPSSPGPIFGKAGQGIEHAQSIIRRWSEQNSIALRQRTDSLIARMAISFTRIGGEINRLTGYDEIEDLKRQIVSQGTSRLRSRSDA
jgi:sensitive to high expression protein 9